MMIFDPWISNLIFSDPGLRRVSESFVEDFFCIFPASARSIYDSLAGLYPLDFKKSSIVLCSSFGKKTWYSLILKKSSIKPDCSRIISSIFFLNSSNSRLFPSCNKKFITDLQEASVLLPIISLVVRNSCNPFTPTGISVNAKRLPY